MPRGCATFELAVLIVCHFYLQSSVDTTRGEAGRVLLFEDINMTSVLSHRSIAAFKPLALVSALATLSFPVAAQVETGQQLTPVTVSESRFESAVPTIGATVITSEQIRESGVSNVNEAIRKVGGVYGRQNMAGGADYQLDLRGFGGFSDQNMVVLVDGIRLSDNEQVTAIMSSVPIELVERIEIVRGGSSVLYGDGATGGTINITTKKGLRNSFKGSVVGEVGNFNREQLRASIAKGWDQFSIDANVSSLKTDNYRQNNQLRQDNFSGGVQWSDDTSRISFRIDSSRQDARFPGSLTYAQYIQNPQQTANPNDYGSFDMDRYTLSGQTRIGAWLLATDLSQKTKRVEFFQFGGLTTYDTKVTQFSPRLRHVGVFGKVENELVTGVDIARSNRVRDSSYANDDFTQRSTAFYVRDELRIDRARIALGARQEKFKQKAIDPTLFGAGNFDTEHSLNAWTLEGSYILSPGLSAYAKAGRSYRMPNIDDSAFLSAPLLPQTSQDREVGLVFGDEQTTKLDARLFQHKLKNEIFINPNTGSNANLDPTERKGIELEGSMRFASDFKLSGVVRHVSAKFTEGAFKGNEVVLVPKNTATLRLYWLPGTQQNADIGIQWADTQRYGGDYSNSCDVRIPAHAIWDARYSRKIGSWEFAITGANLTDKNYFTQAFGACQSGIYPEAGRSVRVSARYDF